jgi:hypothetical protein
MQEALDEIPKPSMSFKQLTDLFATKGLGVRDLVWLSGTPYMMTDHITRQGLHACLLHYTTQHMDPSLAKRKLVRTEKAWIIAIRLCSEHMNFTNVKVLQEVKKE